MENATSTMEFLGAGLTLLAAIVSVYYARSSKKSENNAKKIENNIEKIKSEMIVNITSKSKIATIEEVRGRTEVFQNVFSKYQRVDNIVGYDLAGDLAQLDKYMAEIKEKNWIFEGEGINLADRLYEELSEIYNEIGLDVDAAEMRGISLALKPKLENYKSALSKISNQNIIN